MLQFEKFATTIDTLSINYNILPERTAAQQILVFAHQDAMSSIFSELFY